MKTLLILSILIAACVPRGPVDPVTQIAEKDGCKVYMTYDPTGNRVYFTTCPGTQTSWQERYGKNQVREEQNSTVQTQVK